MHKQVLEFRNFSPSPVSNILWSLLLNGYVQVSILVQLWGELLKCIVLFSLFPGNCQWHNYSMKNRMLCIAYFPDFAKTKHRFGCEHGLTQEDLSLGLLFPRYSFSSIPIFQWIWNLLEGHERERKHRDLCAVSTLNTPEVLCTFEIRFYQTTCQDIFCIKLRINQRRHPDESQPSLLCCHQLVLLKRTSFKPDFFLAPESFQWLSKL